MYHIYRWRFTPFVTYIKLYAIANGSLQTQAPCVVIADLQTRQHFVTDSTVTFACKFIVDVAYLSC